MPNTRPSPTLSHQILLRLQLTALSSLIHLQHQPHLPTSKPAGCQQTRITKCQASLCRRPSGNVTLERPPSMLQILCRCLTSWVLPSPISHLGSFLCSQLC